MKGIHEEQKELKPTMGNLADPYVLQLIAALSKAGDEIDELNEIIDKRVGVEHFGPYGAVCMHTGQLDAGECWLCYAKRKKQEAAEMQLVAGRYQHLHEEAQKALNKIDDFFEYPYRGSTPDQIRVTVYEALANYTKAVSKVIR